MLHSGVLSSQLKGKALWAGMVKMEQMKMLFLGNQTDDESHPEWRAGSCSPSVCASSNTYNIASYNTEKITQSHHSTSWHASNAAFTYLLLYFLPDVCAIMFCTIKLVTNRMYLHCD